MSQNIVTNGKINTCKEYNAGLKNRKGEITGFVAVARQITASESLKRLTRR